MVAVQKDWIAEHERLQASVEEVAAALKRISVQAGPPTKRPLDNRAAILADLATAHERHASAASALEAAEQDMDEARNAHNHETERAQGILSARRVLLLAAVLLLVFLVWRHV